MKRRKCPNCSRIVQIQLDSNQELCPVLDKHDHTIIESPPPQKNNFPLPMPDKRIIAFDLKRQKEDQLQTQVNPITTSCLRCNTCTSFCGSRSQAKNTAFYIPGYFCKLPTELGHSLPVFYDARQEAKKYPSIKEDTDTAKLDAQYTVTKH